MDELPGRIRADRLLGNRLRLGVYGGRALNVSKHTTREYAVVWVLRGSGTYIDAKNCRIPFGPGDVYQRFPGRVHGHRWENAVEGLTCFAAVPAPFLAGLRLAAPAGLHAPVFHAGLDSTLVKRWVELTRTLRSVAERELPRVMAEVLVLIGDLLVRCHAQELRDGWLDRAKGLIDAHLCDRTPMPKILAPLDGSYATSRGRFHHLAGCSPGVYRIRRRMELAQDLLASQDLSVAAVADQLGFDEASNFSKQFMLQCGCTPGEFRAKIE